MRIQTHDYWTVGGGPGPMLGGVGGSGNGLLIDSPGRWDLYLVMASNNPVVLSWDHYFHIRPGADTYVTRQYFYLPGNKTEVYIAEVETISPYEGFQLYVQQSYTGQLSASVMLNRKG